MKPLAQRHDSLRNRVDLAAIFGEVTEEIVRAAGVALYNEANAIMLVAKEITTPVESGALAASGRVGDPVRDQYGVSVTLSFGDAATNSYAVFVHEDPHARHGAAIGKPAGQTYKYLEKPTLAAAPDLPERVAAAIKAALK